MDRPYRSKYAVSVLAFIISLMTTTILIASAKSHVKSIVFDPQTILKPLVTSGTESLNVSLPPTLPCRDCSLEANRLRDDIRKIEAGKAILSAQLIEATKLNEVQKQSIIQLNTRVKDLSSASKKSDIMLEQVKSEKRNTCHSDDNIMLSKSECQVCSSSKNDNDYWWIAACIALLAICILASLSRKNLVDSLNKSDAERAAAELRHKRQRDELIKSKYVLEDQVSKLKLDAKEIAKTKSVNSPDNLTFVENSIEIVEGVKNSKAQSSRVEEKRISKSDFDTPRTGTEAELKIAINEMPISMQLIAMQQESFKDKNSLLEMTNARDALAATVCKLENDISNGNTSESGATDASDSKRISEIEIMLQREKAMNDSLIEHAAELESQVAKDKANDAALMTAKAAAESRVSELEAQVAKYKSFDLPSGTLKAAAESRVSELEAQLAKDKVDSLRQTALVRAAADNRVSELESQLAKANADKQLSSRSSPRTPPRSALPSGTLKSPGVFISPSRDASASSSSKDRSKSIIEDLPDCSSDAKIVAMSFDIDDDDSVGPNDLSIVSDYSAAVGSESDEMSTIPNECGDSDDESGEVNFLNDRVRDKKLVYKKFVGRIFENLKLRKTLTMSQKSGASPTYRTFMVNSIVRLDGKKQLYFVYYDVLSHPKGPPSKKDTSAWTLCPCRHLIAKSSVYRFK